MHESTLEFRAEELGRFSTTLVITFRYCLKVERKIERSLVDKTTTTYNDGRRLANESYFELKKSRRVAKIILPNVQPSHGKTLLENVPK